MDHIRILLGLWFLSVMGIAFFLYATVCFCVMFTGQLFALPVYFLAVNYVAFAFSSGAHSQYLAKDKEPPLPEKPVPAESIENKGH